MKKWANEMNHAQRMKGVCVANKHGKVFNLMGH